MLISWRESIHRSPHCLKEIIEARAQGQTACAAVRSLNFARQTEHLLAERVGNPETGISLELVQNGPHDGQEAGRLGLKQQA
jgi:hypothetical protein